MRRGAFLMAPQPAAEEGEKEIFLPAGP